VTTKEGIHFVEICAGISPGIAAQVKINGGSPGTYYDYLSTSQGGVDSSCRSALMYLTLGVRISLFLSSGAVYSNDNVQTALSVFSVSDAIQDAENHTAYIFTDPSSDASFGDYEVPFTGAFITPRIQDTYNTALKTYTCRQTAPYFFTVTAGVASSKNVQLQFEGFPLSLTLRRSSGLYNGLTTVARSFLVNCTAGTSVQVTLQLGEVSTGAVDHNLLSFAAFPYTPSKVTATSWAAYRSSGVDASSQTVSPVTFDKVVVNQGSVLNSNTGTVTIQSTGYYYVYMSTAAPAGLGMYMSMYRRTADGQTSKLFAIYRTSTISDSFETLVSGRIVRLYVGDVISVSVERGYQAYTENSEFQISFIGMLLYYA